MSDLYSFLAVNMLCDLFVSHILSWWETHPHWPQIAGHRLINLTTLDVAQYEHVESTRTIDFTSSVKSRVLLT